MSTLFYQYESEYNMMKKESAANTLKELQKNSFSKDILIFDRDGYQIQNNDYVYIVLEYTTVREIRDCSDRFVMILNESLLPKE